MKRYQGLREDGIANVTVNGEPLNARLDLRNHSPDGFEWGYGGSGPTQLALALLVDYLDDDDEAVRLYQEFKRGVVVGLPRQGWILTALEMTSAVEALRAQLAITGPTESQPGKSSRASKSQANIVTLNRGPWR